MRRKYVPPHLRQHQNHLPSKQETRSQSKWCDPTLRSLMRSNTKQNAQKQRRTKRVRISWHKEEKKPANYVQVCEILIAGYMRNAEQSLSSSNTINTFVPSAIKHIIYHFYVSPTLPQEIYVNIFEPRRFAAANEATAASVGVYKLNVADINSSVPMQKVLSVQMKDNTAICHAPNISDYHPYFLQHKTHAIYDAIIHLKFNHMADALQPEFVAFKPNMLRSCSINKGLKKDEHDLICQPLQDIEIDDRVNQFVFCKQYGVVFNDMWSITRITWDTHNVVSRHDIKYKPECMRMVYLEHDASVFLIGNGRNKNIQKVMMYDLAHDRVTDIAGYEYRYIACRNQPGVRFRTGLCVNKMETNKVYLASNLGHVSVYHAQRNMWDHLFYDADTKHNLMLNNFAKAPVIWCNDYQPRILYALQADNSSFAALKYLYFDTREHQKKGWNACRVLHEYDELYRFPWKDATWFH